MTQDEIIEMAELAGLFIANDSEGQFSAVHDGEIFDMYPNGDKERDRLYREQRFVEILGPFAKLVAAKEREACAKTCESLFDPQDDTCDEAEQCAAAIRARGEA